jgi:hypothetical protein
MLDILVTLAGLLELVVALIILGEPVRLFAERVSTLFKNLNFVEICILDIYLGGLVLYAIALPPWHLFSTPIITGILFVFLTISIAYRWKLKKPYVAQHMERKKGEMIEQAFVIGLFCFLLCLQVFPLTSLLYGSVRDVSLHSLLAQVIVQNKYLPNTMLPYSTEGIIYPAAAHVIFAFTAILTGWVVPQAIFYVTQLFNALAVVAAYFLARRISLNRAFHISTAFVFTFVSAWPLFVTWGSNPFVAGFPLFLVCLGLLLTMFFNPERRGWKEFIMIGLLFGYLGAIMVSFLQTLMVIAILWLFIQVFRKSPSKNCLLGFALLFSVSIIPVAPFIYRFIIYYPYPGHNVGLPADFMGYSAVQQSFLQGIQWAIGNLAPYPFLGYEMIAICALSIILFFCVEKERIARARGLPDGPFLMALLVVASSTILSLVAFLLPPDFSIVSWGHQGIILAVGLSLLVALFGHHLFAFLHNVGSKFLNDDPKKPQATIVISILLISAIYAPFVYSRTFLDPWGLKGAYSMFAVTSMQDNELMFWMRGNLTEDAVILVNPNEASLFIPSISHKKTVFTTTGSQLSRSYQKLCDALSNETLNVTCYDIMKSFNITYVYVGSAATYWWVKDYKWLPELFLGNPNFELVKKVGDACLFKVLYKNSSLVFQDDFEHESWYDYGWNSAHGYDDHGLGNITLAEDFGNHSQKCLKITAQAVYTVATWKYAQYVWRQFFVPNDSDVQLSFDFNAAEGFHGKDTFAVVISNIYGNQSIILTTPNGTYANYTNSVSLEKFEGSWSSDLTALWNQKFNSSFPASFFLEFVNYDFDGVQNVVYIDNVNVTAISRS